MQKKEEHDKPDKHSRKSTKEFVLQLYVTGATPNSVRALTNIKQICDEYLKGRYSLEIIDVYQQKELAEKEQLIALPLLIRRLPMPEKRMIGDLSDKQKVLSSLGLVS